jgi:ribosomal protein S1
MSSEVSSQPQDEAVQTPDATPVELATPPETQNGASPSGLAALHAKMKIQGKVKRTELQGAIIDLGLEADGLLHISQLSAEPVKNVTDVLTEGQEVTAYILAVDPKSKRIDLTLIPMPELSWNDIRVNNDYEGTIERIEKYGVFVNIGAERPGLIHVSELAKGYVSDPNEVVKVGDQIKARVIGVNKRKKQIDLSVRALEASESGGRNQSKEAQEDMEDVPVMNAMEFALRKAMGTLDGASGSSKADKKRKKQGLSQQHDDVMARTLRFRG